MPPWSRTPTTTSPRAPGYPQGPNYRLRPDDFPFRKLVDSKNRESAIAADTNNVASSQGVHHALYGQAGRPEPDPDGFRVGQGVSAANVRRVEPRNTPTMINAVFNHRNFWDMRAQNVFNGVNPFGERDVSAFVYRADTPTNPRTTRVRLEHSSLASQAVGPPTNRFEMSAEGRAFPDVGRALMLEIGRRHREAARRLKNVRPLGKQLVHPDDSVLGPYTRWPDRGLGINYESLIRRAFHRQWWDSPRLIRVAADGTTTVVDRREGLQAADEFTLMEYNFSLFFGLAVQIYEATLVSDKIPGLRNVELTAPYFHNGGERTLLDVVNFYARGGNLGGNANPILTRNGTVIGGLSVLNFNTAANATDVMADLVEFLKALTDERVRIAAAPFDHPQLFVPDGHPGDERVVTQQDGQAVDALVEVPATGRSGGPVLNGFLE